MDKEVERIKGHLRSFATVLGHMPLIDEPLTDDDWAEVYRSYLTFQHHVGLIVLKAHKRGINNDGN